jgi:hypothetical protein
MPLLQVSYVALNSSALLRVELHNQKIVFSGSRKSFFENMYTKIILKE